METIVSKINNNNKKSTFTLFSILKHYFLSGCELIITTLLLKSRWDEWVPEERLKKYNEENIKKQKVLVEAQRARDAAERIAQAKLMDAEAAKRAAALGLAGGNGVSGGSSTPMTMGSVGSMSGGAGRRDEKRSGKGRAGEVSRLSLITKFVVKLLMYKLYSGGRIC